MTFWLIALLIVAVVAALLVLALVRGRNAAGPAESFDLQVYRDQLKEVEKDLARGTLSEEDAERTRIEISRKILETDRKIQSGTTGGKAPKVATYAAIAATLAVLFGGAAYVYSLEGAPGYPDLPLKARIAASEKLMDTRPTQAEMEAEQPATPEGLNVDPRHKELVEKLRQVVEERPEDIQGLTLLARNEASLGNYQAAYAVQQRLLTAKGDAATADDYADLADMMSLAAGGYISPEAELALRGALSRDPQNGTARYYIGLMYAQGQRPDVAFRIWRDLLNDSTPAAPWVPLLRATLPELAQYAGVKYTLPPEADTRGPTAEDMQAAAQMSPEERMDMIRGMVNGLADRLATEGGTAAEWAQLIAALGNLGETDRAAAIWGEAQGLFAARPDDLATVRAAAESAGVAE